MTSPPTKPGVVSDTGPVNYLLQIEQIELLPQLVGRVWVPKAVMTELTDRAAPERVRSWMAHVPDWLFIQEPSSQLRPMAGGAGERAAIALARERKLPLL